MAVNRRTLLIAAGAVVVAAGAAIAMFAMRAGSVDVAVAQSGGTPSELMEAGPLGELAMGAADAPVTVIEYLSLTCPHCRNFHVNTFGALKEKYIDSGQVRFIFREFPLDQFATAGAMLARCVPETRGIAVIDLLFEQYNDWIRSDQPAAALLELLRQAGFTQESFEACLTNQEILDGVNWVRDRAANQFGVNSTPTFFVNGERATGALSIAEMEALIDPHL